MRNTHSLLAEIQSWVTADGKMIRWDVEKIRAILELDREQQREAERLSWVMRISSFLGVARKWRSEWAKGKTYLADPEKYPIQTLATDLALAIEDFEMAMEGDSQTDVLPSQGNPSSPSHQTAEHALRVIRGLAIHRCTYEAIQRTAEEALHDSSKRGNE